jgi:oxygen-independent coproporphyrinogen-3 oxidase
VAVGDLRKRFGQVEELIEEMRMLAALDGDGIVTFDGLQLRVTERGRPFVRSIAAAFDAYLGGGAGRHSIAV